MGAKDFFKNQSGLKPDSKGVIKDNLDDSLVDVESSAHAEERLEEKNYLLPDIDYSDPANFVRYGLAYEYYNNAFIRIRTQYPYDGSAAEKLAFYNDLTPLEKYVFDQKYPKYNGFVTLGLGSYGGGTPATFGTTTNPQYIRFYGGPHEGNVINSNVGQENNLHLDLEDGFTVEFWLKKDGPASTLTQTAYESLLNIRNEQDTQRFFLYIDNGTSQNRIYYHQENWNGASYDPINSGYFDLGLSVSANRWRHYAFSFKKLRALTQIKSICYVNGQEVDTNTYSVGAGSPVYTITGSVVGTINGAGGSDGATPSISAISDEAGYGKPVSASYDEFRIWKTERTGKQVGLNWFRNVHGGTNSDSTKYYFKSSADNKPVDLAIYFKFNEGIISSTGAGTYDPGNEAESVTAIGDNLVLDYSGRISNGIFVGYSSSLSMRSEDSAIVLGGAADAEEKDPLLFIENSDYSSALTPLLASGSAHDVSNTTALYNNLPEWIREDDIKNGSEIKKLLQIMGSYFDTVHAQIEHLRQFREAKYIDSQNKTTDYISSLLKAHGFNVPELFVDPDVLSSIYDQDEKRVFEEKLFNLKNKIYKNIYTNLIAIYKAKGTEKGFRNLFRCYGTDDELFKINLYADGVEYQVDDKTYDSLVKKRLVDFSGFRDSSDRSASIYQRTTVGTEFGFYPSSSNVDIPMTVEAQIVFPNKPDIPSLEALDILPTASLFGVHSSSLSHTDATVPASDCDFQIQTRRNSGGFTQFVLTSSTGFFPELTSSFFYDEEKQVYDDVPWNLAVRLYPKQYPFSSYVTQSQQFTLNFYGVKNYLGTTFAEFDVSTDITRNKAGQFLTGSNKRFYIGADKVNFSGSVNYKSDVKFARFMVWNSYLTNDEITKHARNSKNYGFSNPYQTAFTYESSTITSSFITKGDTLALNWEFDTVEEYNDKSLDSTSGSQFEVAKYPIHNFGYYNGQNYPGQLDSFVSDKTSTVLELMQGNIIQRPDALYGKNMVEIKNNDYESFKTNKKPVKMFFAFEASQNEVISRDMLSFFSDVVSFNNLYGEAVHEFRHQYKELEHFKRFYFSKIDSVADIDKFVNLYKFLDNALDSVITNLVPASAATSEKIRTVIEDHTLDRHKVQKPYNLLIQDFEEKLNKAEEISGYNTKNLPLRTSDVDSGNVDTTRLIFPEDDRRAPIINGRTIRQPLRTRDAGTGLGIEGRRTVQQSLYRTSERSRIGLNPASTARRYVFANNSQEKDRGDLLVGNVSVDTVRTQVDINNKFNNAKQTSTNYIVTSEIQSIYGREERGEVNILNNKFSNTSQDGYKLLLSDFPLQYDFVEDISDTSLYGVREYPTTLENRSTGEVYAGFEALPKEVKILSSSADPYFLLAEKNFEIEYIRHDSNVGSVANKLQNKQLLESPTNRKELFSLSTVVPSSYAPVQIYFTSPQITFNSTGTATFDSTKPTNLVRERSTIHVLGPKEDYNWSGKSADIIGTGPTDHDVSTDPSTVIYSVADSTYIEDLTTGLATYDRVAISRSINDDDDAFYYVIDRGIFRDRTDVETEQLSPNANLNYKNLMIKRAITRAYSTPNTLDNSGYMNVGSDIGMSIHSSLANAHLVVEPAYTQSFIQDYDNGYIIRSSQNHYDQRWYRSSNMVRLSDTNNSPYINRNFYSSYSSIIGALTSYAPLTTTNYDLSDQYTIPHDEETASTTTFGNTYVDFAGLNIVTNREVDVTNRSINPTTNNYINPKIVASISNKLRLHYYLANSNGPFAYSLERTRLSYAGPVTRSERYRNSFPYILSDVFDYEAAQNFDILPISSKARMGKAIIQDTDGLKKIKIEVFYPSIEEYFDETTHKFIKLPKKLAKPILESEHNSVYNSIFSQESQTTNSFLLKYFDFAEQVFPRAQKSIKLLSHYETDTDFLIDQANRKSSQTTNSLGKQFADTSTFEARMVSLSFSSWATETFPIIDFGSTFAMYDGELMQMNYDNAYTAFIAAGPYQENHYNQTFGYRINHKNRSDSSIPNGNLMPYKYYETMLSNIDTDTRGIIAEYRSKNSIEDYFDNGCTEISSEPSLFGYDYSSDSKKLLGLASYSDEVFTLKDIHKQIDRF